MIFPIGASEYDAVNYELIGPKMRITLSADYHRLLMRFLVTPNELVLMEDLFEAVAGGKNKLRVYISNLRKNLRLVGAPHEIENKHNKGYVFIV